jgi:hypothetical protein
MECLGRQSYIEYNFSQSVSIFTIFAPKKRLRVQFQLRSSSLKNFQTLMPLEKMHLKSFQIIRELFQLPEILKIKFQIIEFDLERMVIVSDPCSSANNKEISNKPNADCCTKNLTICTYTRKM